MAPCVPMRGACALAFVGAIAVLTAVGCGKASDGDGASDSADAGRGAVTQGGAGGGSAGVGVGGGLSLPNGGATFSAGSGGGSFVGKAGGPGFEECAGDVVTGELAPLDIFIMLDTSASMLDASGAGVDKWQAVKLALTEFLNDEASAGIGVGIQYFPQRRAGVPARCRINSDCGVGGPCVLNACAQSGDLCTTDDECGAQPGGLDECVPLGSCANDATLLCREGVAGDCVDASLQSVGPCRLLTESYCEGSTECAAAPYAAPAVPITELPAGASALVTSIESQEPAGRTPTGPAIRGALEHARAWASSHPGHSVVVLLATDGLPTECTPLEIPNIARLTASGYTSTPSVRTFVVGVFGANDVEGENNLTTIAQAGGTEKAFIVDASADVSAQFVAALNEIRGSRLGCEFQIPEPMGNDPLDYDLVNVQLTNEGVTTPLFFVGSSGASCDANGGWYYDTDPATAAPSRIVMCPSTCRAVEAAAEASVQIQLGCRIRVR